MSAQNKPPGRCGYLRGQGFCETARLSYIRNDWGKAWILKRVQHDENTDTDPACTGITKEIVRVVPDENNGASLASGV